MAKTVVLSYPEGPSIMQAVGAGFIIGACAMFLFMSLAIDMSSQRARWDERVVNTSAPR